MSNYIVKELYQDLDRFVSWEAIFKREIKGTKCISDLDCLFEKYSNIEDNFCRQRNSLIEKELRLKYIFLKGLDGKKLLLKTARWNIRCYIGSKFVCLIRYIYLNDYMNDEGPYLDCRIFNIGVKKRRRLSLFKDSIKVSTAFDNVTVNEIFIEDGNDWKKIYPML